VQHDERGLLQALWAALRSPLPPGYRATPTFGWLLVVLFAAQLFTGVLLAMYYQAVPSMAGESVRYLMRDVAWGWLIRGVHHWTSHGMIVLCGLQLLRFLVNGAYRGARAGHWVLGLAMTVLIVALAFGGGVLVWDQSAFWQVTRVLKLIHSLPVVGAGLARILCGGDEDRPTTLRRAYAAHALLLPGTLALLLGLNLWFPARRRARGTTGGGAR
jgi:quinol-cytochrome oxidoreductase complex cytochrome b subunit